MSRLSDAVEAVRIPSFSPGSRTATHTPDSVRSGGDPLQPSRKTNMNIHMNVNMMCDASPYGNLAKEFGVEPHLVEALAHRLSRLS